MDLVAGGLQWCGKNIQNFKFDSYCYFYKRIKYYVILMKNYYFTKLKKRRILYWVHKLSLARPWVHIEGSEKQVYGAELCMKQQIW